MTPGSPVPGHLARPAGSGPHAAVLVVHEILGLNDDIRRIADTFAERGYVAFAPDLFAGRGPSPLCVIRALGDWHRRRGPAFDALEACRVWLGELPDVDAARMGIAGFCMGGGFALLLGARTELGVAAAFYCDVPRRAEELEGLCPTLGFFGAQDLVMGRNAARLRSHLEALGLPGDVVVYPNAGHSFMSVHGGLAGAIGRWGPLRARPVPEASDDAWRRLAAFFEVHLGV